MDHKDRLFAGSKGQRAGSIFGKKATAPRAISVREIQGGRNAVLRAGMSGEKLDRASLLQHPIGQIPEQEKNEQDEEQGCPPIRQVAENREVFDEKIDAGASEQDSKEDILRPHFFWVQS
jgi:hypothetical protein